MPTSTYPTNTVPRLFLAQTADVTEISQKIAELSNQVHDLSLVIGGKKITGSGKKISVSEEKRLINRSSKKNSIMTTLKNIIIQKTKNSLFQEVLCRNSKLLKGKQDFVACFFLCSLSSLHICSNCAWLNSWHIREPMLLLTAPFILSDESTATKGG
jgi:hypothetical protein